jgi:hypothetical protein
VEKPPDADLLREVMDFAAFSDSGNRVFIGVWR